MMQREGKWQSNWVGWRGYDAQGRASLKGHVDWPSIGMQEWQGAQARMLEGG